MRNFLALMLLLYQLTTGAFYLSLCPVIKPVTLGSKIGREKLFLRLLERKVLANA
jgi:hypothetical protein